MEGVLSPGTGFTDGGLEAIRAWLRAYVDQGRLPGAVVLVARGGRMGLFECHGVRDLDTGEPVEADTIFRIYSMTKPVTAVAALTLLEDGLLALDDPVSQFVPSFERLTVNRHGSADVLHAVPAARPMTVRHLLTHTSGLTYGVGHPGAVARLYVERRTDFGPGDGPLAEVVDRLAEIPLLHDPGEAWSYGVSSDVLGRVIEVSTGVPLDAALRGRVLDPLGMHDTVFSLGAERTRRLAALYRARVDGSLLLGESAVSSAYVGHVTTLSGGAGLLSTAGDFFRFAEMLRHGGTLDGARLLDPSTVSLMTGNQLPGDLASFGQPTFNETETDGVGFGLGVSVVVEPSRTVWRSARGEFAWGGYASTAFWVDPEHEVTVVFLTQVIPSDRYPIRAELRSLVMDALE